MPVLRPRRAIAAARFAALAAFAVLLTSPLHGQARAPTRAPAPAAADSAAWWRHVTVLAHDSMRGRATGSAEHRRAAEYVARAFARAGLTPAGAPGHGYLQPVRLVERRVDEARSSVALVRGGRAEPLALGTEAYLGARAASAVTVEAPVVFAGYGLHLPEHGHDDLAGLDLRGKVVAYIGAPPKGIPGPVVADARSRQWEALRAAGAVGTVAFYGALRGGAGMDIPWARAALNRLAPQMALADSAGAPGQPQVTVTMRGDLGERFFAGSPHRFADVVALAESGLLLPRFALPVAIRAVTRTTARPVVSENVAGLLPGTDLALRNEVVVLTAHLDHVGVGRPVNGDSIFNGAMDNASGTAALLEVAATFAEEARAGRGLRRSVAFVAVTAEEKGLLGSRFYAQHPTVGAGRLVANINTDMFLPLVPFRGLIVNGLEESDLADDVRRVGRAAGVAVLSDPEPGRNGFIRSDQYSFIRAGVPALSLKVGFTADSPEHEVIKRWRAERYHAVGDDLAQPVDHAAAAGFLRVYTQLVREVANRPTRPEWNPDSPFRRYAREAALP